MKKMFGLSGICILLLMATAKADTISFTGVVATVGMWGPNGLVYGQVFTAPQQVLDDYSFSLLGSDQFPFVSQIYAWNSGNETTVGSPIYTSAINELLVTDFATYSFAPGLLLNSGDQYIAIVTNYPDGVNSLGGSGGGEIALSGDTSGQGFFWNWYDSSGGWDSGIWPWCCSFGSNLVFQAHFSDPSSSSAVPVAPTLSLFATSLGFLGLLNWRRKRKGT